MSNIFETVGDTRNVSMNDDNETGVALSDSINKTYLKGPQSRKQNDDFSRLFIVCLFIDNNKQNSKDII